ncbi:MAG: S8 family peptidase [Pseudomonadota bacterium]
MVKNLSTSLIKILLTTAAIFWSALPAYAIVTNSQLKNTQDLMKLVEKNKPAVNSAYSYDFFSPYLSWGLDPEDKKSSINIKEVWQNFKKKKEIVVAVIDTGIDPSHPFIKDNITVIEGNFNSSDNYGVDFSKDHKFRSRPEDSHGHGTHVAGIIRSVFPEVKILSLKYYNPTASGQDNLNSTIEALRYAVEKGVDVINYSGGGPEPSTEELKALKMAADKGILVVAAAGNEESDIDNKKNAYYPASYGLSNIITVTAHDQSMAMLSASNWGKKSVDISAPGQRIRSSLPSGRSGYLTGTSQATAFVSGVAAMIKSQYPEISATVLKQIIVDSANKESILTTKCASGGRLDASSAYSLARKMYDKSDVKRDVAGQKGEIKQQASSRK